LLPHAANMETAASIATVVTKYFFLIIVYLLFLYEICFCFIAYIPYSNKNKKGYTYL